MEMEVQARRFLQRLCTSSAEGGTEDDLFHFKSGFSKDKFLFETWRIIGDAQKYADLVKSCTYAMLARDSFLPKYRIVG
jgi:hypothetical protein